MRAVFFNLLRSARAGPGRRRQRRGGRGSIPSYGIAMYGDPGAATRFCVPALCQRRCAEGRHAGPRRCRRASIRSIPSSLKGRAPWYLSPLTVETLMGRSYDEPFTLYGLLAESVRDRAGPRLGRIHPEPQGTILGRRAGDGRGRDLVVRDPRPEGDPRYAGAWAKVGNIEQTGPRTVRFTFTTADRELPLILGLRPVLEKAQWAGQGLHRLDASRRRSARAPMSSAISSPGGSSATGRTPTGGARDLPFNRGRFNFDTIRDEYFGDDNALFEAFKAGEVEDLPRRQRGEVGGRTTISRR